MRCADVLRGGWVRVSQRSAFTRGGRSPAGHQFPRKNPHFPACMHKLLGCDNALVLHLTPPSSSSPSSPPFSHHTHPQNPNRWRARNALVKRPPRGHPPRSVGYACKHLLSHYHASQVPRRNDLAHIRIHARAAGVGSNSGGARGDAPEREARRRAHGAPQQRRQRRRPHVRRD